MNRFLKLALPIIALFAVSATGAEGQAQQSSGPTILTVTGEIGTTNRPPFDAFMDSLFAALDEKFDRAYAFSRADLLAMPHVEVTTKYPNWPAAVTVRGPLLRDVLAKAEATSDNVVVQAVDGYSPNLELSELGDAPIVLALTANGAPIGIGGRGPVWLVFPSDATDQPAADDGGLSWALFHIKVLPHE